ncbi:MAG: toxin-antitoxin system YwqK family antitoxin [Fusobacteriaceae bacterium]
MNNIKKIIILIIILISSINSYSKESKIMEKKANNELEKKMDIEKINNKMKEFDYLNRELRSDKKVYLKGEKIPFTGTFALKLGHYVEYTEVYENGILQGDKTWYDHQGNIMMIETYVKGRKNGEQITYYKNTKIRSIVDYNDNRIIGLEWYNDKGERIFKESYVKGTGKWKVFWSDGKINEDGQYLNYLKNGDWKTYDIKGNLELIKTYKNGRLVKRNWE